MRFRRRAPRRRTARKMHGDWVVAIDHDCFLPIPVDQPCSGGGTGGAFLNDTLDFSLIDTTDVTDKEDALTVVRVVGDLPTVCWVHGVLLNENMLMTITLREGIYLSTVDPNGVAIDMDPRMPGDMESDCWLYLRTRTFKFAGTNPTSTNQSVIQWQSGADYAGQQSDHLDLRVKRKLKRGQELIYTVGGYHESLEGPGPAGIVLSAAMHGHLRAYVKY